jgi:hypothetical protein
MRIGGLLGGAVLLAALARPAAAEFFDCTTDAAAKAIDPTAPFTCVVLDEDLVPMADGFAPFRIVADATSSEADLAPWMAMMIEVIKANTAAWSQHYALRMAPLTVVLFDPNDPASPIGDALGLFSGLEGQCLIRVNTRLLASGTESDVFFRRVVAHELAHCLQHSTWPVAANQAGTGWWIEGGADMLASVLYPLTANDLARQSNFDAQSSVVPLTQMKYEASTFFYWLWGKDPKLVFRLMAAMPTVPGEAAQRSALRAFMESNAVLAAVGDGGLDRFAQDYIDGDIRDPRGVVVVSPNLGPPVIFDETRSVNFPAQPFTIQRALLGFIGDFALPTFNAYSTVWSRPANNSGDWGELPLFLDQDGCEQPLMYKVARMPTMDADKGFRLDANLTESCALCTPTQDHDACLIGKWTVDLELLALDLRNRAARFSGVGDITGSITFDLQASGGFTVAYDNVFVGGVAGSDTIGAAAWWVKIGGADKGLWSAANGVLTFCVHEPGSVLVTTVTLADGQDYAHEHAGFAQSGVYSYGCAASALLEYSGPIAMPEGYAPRWMLLKQK